MHALLNKLSPSATDMIRADHTRVLGSFHRFAADARPATKQALVNMICTSLQVHAQLEEEIFYPAMRAAIGDEDLLDEAVVEHASAKDLIVQILSMDPHEELYDAKVTVLGEYVDHHAKEEEKQMFPKVRKARLDLEYLAEQIQERKQQAVQ